VSPRRIEPGDRPERPPDCALVIFGASGDLTRRKLVPALYYLAKAGLLPQGFAVLGMSSTDMPSEAWREKLGSEIGDALEDEPLDAEIWRRLEERLYYLPGSFEDPAAYERLGRKLAEIEKRHDTGGSVLFYLATPPDFFGPIAERLSAAGLVREEAGRFRRLIVEKPFGRDLDSALELDRKLCSVLREHQILRIDHYLGKETVQNILVFRWANGIFEPLWNRNHVDHVQITVGESIGVEGRGAYYEESGALRDMIQNHLLQVLCLVAMEPPASFQARFVRAEKLQILEALRLLQPGNAVRGQYGIGQNVPGYRQEPGVDPKSKTETFAAMKLELESWRWAGVPFYLRTGKRLPRKVSEVSIQFRDAPLHLFACTAMQPCAPNLLRLRIQPDEGISLRVLTKTPGLEVIGRPVELDFAYGVDLERESPGAYETLLLDVLEGDSLLFATGDWVEAAWGVVDPLLEAWAAAPPADFPNYAAGSWGPKAADDLLQRDGRRWHLP